MDPCPFFLKSGFCPRRLLCKLDHTPSNPKQQDDSDQDKTPPTQSSPQGLGSPAKKFHLSDSADNLAKNFPGNPLLSDKNLPGSGVEFFRSISLPATQNVLFHCKSEEQPHSKSKSLEAVSKPPNVSPHSRGVDSITESDPLIRETQLSPKIQEITPELPQTFDFSKRSTSSVASEDTPRSANEEKDGVFVFTATSPTGDDVVKKKNSAVAFDTSSSLVTGDGGVRGDGVRGGRVVAGNDRIQDVASLAQQLGLDSDNVRTKL